MTADKRLRTQIADFVGDWQQAHVTFDASLKGLPVRLRGAVPAGLEHSIWQIVEHMRIAQADILDFCVNPKYEHTMKWPDDYWPRQRPPSSAAEWSESIQSYGRSREQLKRLARDVHDLTALVPTGKGSQTYLRAILMTADHTAYHVGQLVAVRRALGLWA